MERDAAVALLRDQHEFPGAFEFRVVVRPKDRGPTVSAMVAGAGDEACLIEVTERPSRRGTYVALHVKIHFEDAEQVLDVYEVLRGMDGILASM